ncbi:MAG: hypothetical protein M1832_006219 [Thelocarpon impressellum]|nr:MAG: hypothetical protein M1832_006219 [Thelocarpon impressellum]
MYAPATLLSLALLAASGARAQDPAPSDASRTQDVSIEEQVRFTTALYPAAVDNLDFESFRKIIAENVTSTFPAPIRRTSSLDALIDVLQPQLKNVDTHHHFGAQVIVVNADRSEAVVNYTCIATHFGRGAFVNDTRIIYGSYMDTLRPVGTANDEPKWKIVDRQSSRKRSTGNAAIFQTGAAGAENSAPKATGTEQGASPNADGSKTNGMPSSSSSSATAQL